MRIYESDNTNIIVPLILAQCCSIFVCGQIPKNCILLFIFSSMYGSDVLRRCPFELERRYNIAFLSGELPTVRMTKTTYIIIGAYHIY